MPRTPAQSPRTAPGRHARNCSLMNAFVRIADDGEILIRGGSVMKEYYNKPEATREVIDAEGWFHTGDIGVIDDGIVKITDRKKDIIVNAGGKNIAPQNLENALKATPYISQVMVHGDKRPYLVALITLNEENVAKWARKLGQQMGEDLGDDIVVSGIDLHVRRPALHVHQDDRRPPAGSQREHLGVAPAGAWQLYVVDDFGGDGGV